MKKINLILATLFLIGISAFRLSFAQLPSGPVKVTAWGQHYGGQVIYRYQVQNLGQSPIKRFLIGHYPSQTNGRAELAIAPKAASNSTTFWLDSQVANSPEGWGVKIVYPEESATLSLEWIEGGYYKQLWPKAPQTPDTPIVLQKKSGIPPGMSWDNFSVTVPVADYAYVTGHATIDYDNDLINVPIVKGDNIPPSINLTVTRLNQNDGNGTWAIFDVKASATDNYDPAPTLVFEPVSSNKMLQNGDIVIASNNKAWNVKLKNIPGKTYQFKFTSMDASGNTTVKTYDYAVIVKN